MADVAVIPPLIHSIYEDGKPVVNVVAEPVQRNSMGPTACKPESGPIATPPRNGTKGYYRNEELGGPIHSERQMDIIVIGAGASGLCLAYKLQRSFSNFSLSIFEKNPEISGTWYENRYPGKITSMLVRWR